MAHATLSPPIPAPPRTSNSDPDALGEFKRQCEKGAHTDKIYCITFDTNNNHLITGSDDCLIKLYDVHRKYVLKSTLKGHSGPIMEICNFGPSRIASASADKTLKIWDLNTGKLVHTYSNHKGIIRFLKEVPYGGNSEIIVSGDEAGYVCFFSMKKATKALLDPIVFPGSSSMVACAVSTSARNVAIGGKGADLQIYKFDDQINRMMIQRPCRNTARLLRWSNTFSSLLEGGSGDGSSADRPWLRVWRCNSPEWNYIHLNVYAGAAKSPFIITDCIWSTDDATVLVMGSDGNVQIWDPATGGQRRKLDAFGASLLNCSPSASLLLQWPASYNFVMTTGEDGTASIFNSGFDGRAQCLSPFTTKNRNIYDAVISKDGLTVAFAGDKKFAVYSCTANKLRTYAGDQKNVFKYFSYMEESIDAYAKNRFYAANIGEIIADKENKYTIVRRIGHGEYGVVFMVYEEITQTFYALKIGSKQHQGPVAISKEKKMLQLSGVNDIVKAFSAFELKKNSTVYQCFIHEMLGPTLSTQIEKSNGLQSNAVKRILRHVLKGLQYVHNILGTCHMDIKPSNICTTIADRDLQNTWIQRFRRLPATSGHLH